MTLPCNCCDDLCACCACGCPTPDPRGWWWQYANRILANVRAGCSCNPKFDLALVRAITENAAALAFCTVTLCELEWRVKKSLMCWW